MVTAIQRWAPVPIHRCRLWQKISNGPTEPRTEVHAPDGHRVFIKSSSPPSEGVDLRQVWKVAENEAPPIRVAVEKLLPPLAELERELAGEAVVEPQNGEG